MIFWVALLGCSGQSVEQNGAPISVKAEKAEKEEKEERDNSARDSLIEHQVFFTDAKRMKEGEMPYLTSVIRYSQADTLPQEALVWLYRGPNKEETGLQLTSCQSTGATIIAVENEIATVQLEGGCGGCGTHTIYDSIKATVTQFDGISTLVVLDSQGRTGQDGRPRCLEP